MNVALKALAAAVALAGFVANASAGATGPASADSLPGNGLGNGTGDLIFAYEAIGGASILWDLVNPAGGARSDLTFNDILTSPGFTITNAAVSSFVSANPGGRWNIFGLTNVRNPNFAASGSNLRYSQAGAAVTVNGQPNVGFNGANAEGAIDLLAQWVSNANSGGLNASDTLTATPTDSWTFSAGGGIHSANLVGQNSSAGLNSTLGFYSLLIDTTKNRGLNAAPSNALGTLLTQTNLGSFTFSLNEGTASLAYAPVPVPPALVLFGSALAGFAGLRRRRAV
jgi:hypothetical protein